MKRRIIIALVVLFLLIASPWILLTSWLTAGNVKGKYEEWRYQSSEEFRESDWKQPNLKYRYSVLDHVAANVVTIGMKKYEVERVLGKPDYNTINGEWQYETQRPGYYFIDFSGGGLLLEFDDQGRVSRVSKNLWID